MGGDIDHLIYMAFALMGIGLLIYSAVSTYTTVGFLGRCAETSGEVIRLEPSSGSGRFATIDYAPVFTFLVNGTAYTVTSNISSSPPDFSVGDRVRVRYEPSNPQNARIHTFFQTWGGPVIFFLAGAGFLGISLYKLGYFH